MIEIKPNCLYARADLAEILKPLGVDVDYFVARIKPRKFLRMLWLGKDLLAAMRTAPALTDQAQVNELPAPAKGELRKAQVKAREEKPAELERAKARFLAIPARKLRAAFATLAGRLGTKDRIVKAYIGHTPGDVLGGHYRKIGMDELRAVSEVMSG